MYLFRRGSKEIVAPPKVLLSLFLIVFSLAFVSAGDIVSPPEIRFNRTINASGTVNNSYYWQGYIPSTLPHNFLYGLQGGTFGQYYHLSASEYADNVYWYNHTVFANLYTDAAINAIVNSYVPYSGAVTDVNLGNHSLNVTNVYLPIDGGFYIGKEASGNTSYFKYNVTSNRLELWVNGHLQQDWGNSTTIYGKATFEADAYFKNMSGEGLLINTNVIVDGNLTANNVFAGNICYRDGTNCTGIKAQSINTTVIVSSGLGNATTSIIPGYLITEIVVTPTTLTNSYRFEANESTSHAVIDRNRIQHTGKWDIMKTYSLNDTVKLVISNASIDENVTVQIKYVNNILS